MKGRTKSKEEKSKYHRKLRPTEHVYEEVFPKPRYAHGSTLVHGNYEEGVTYEDGIGSNKLKEGEEKNNIRQYDYMVIYGGLGISRGNLVVLDDLWFLNLQTRKWRLVKSDPKFLRSFHH